MILHDYSMAITKSDIYRYLNSQFRIEWSGFDYTIRDLKNQCTVAVDFVTFIDALVFLEETHLI